MIYDKLTNLALYAFENPRMMSCVQDIKSHLHEQLHDQAAEAKDFTKNQISFTTTSKKEKRYEAHKKYIDIHIVLEGREYVEVSHIDCLSNQTEYNSQHDIYFGDVTSDVKFTGYLEKGYFLICFPEDTHLVGAHEHIEQEVNKIIYKIEA
jgi:YhcH/YjgK/YiaL family protein